MMKFIASLSSVTRTTGVAALLAVTCWARQAAPAAHACTPPPGGPPRYSVEARVMAAPIVIRGVVKSVDDPANWSVYGATVEVSEYFKGQGDRTLSIGGYGSPAMCLVGVLPGERHVFYVERDGQGNYWAHYLEASDAVDPDTPEIVSQVWAALLPYRFGLPSLLCYDPPPPDGMAPFSPSTSTLVRAR